MRRPHPAAIFGVAFAAGCIALSASCIAAEAERAPLGEEAAAARRDAEQILSKPIFKRAKEGQPFLERLGRYLLGLARRLFHGFQRILGTKYASLFSYIVSGAVILLAIGALLWFIVKTPRAPPAGGPARQAPDDQGGGRPTLFPLSHIEKAVECGELGTAAGMLADWFIACAYDPSYAPWWLTNRELLPQLRGLKPLVPNEWESLVSFHESLRYAGYPPERAVVERWLDRARRAWGDR